MDANGLSFHLLAEPAHWRSLLHARWNPACRTVALASERALDAPIDTVAFNAAQVALAVVPRAADGHGGVARWDAAAQAIVVHGPLPGDVPLWPLTETPTDLAVGSDGVLYVALPGRVLMHDLRERFADASVALAGFAPWRLAAHADGGLWVMERTSGRLARLTGRPLPLTTPARDDYDPGVFRPVPENCHPPTLTLLPDVAWDAGERPLALAAHPDAGLALLAWGVDGEARLRRLGADHRLAPARVLGGARYAYALAWLDDTRLALRMPARRDAPAFPANPEDDSDTAPLRPLGPVFPLAADAQEAPFAHGLDGPPLVPLSDGGVDPLLPLSLPSLARHGWARHWRAALPEAADRLLDAGRPGAVWHRLMAEAAIPPGTAFIAWAAATETPEPPPDDDSTLWHPHGFGRDVVALAPQAMTAQAPCAAWQRAPSELPGHPGLAPWLPERGVRGLFEVLLQQPRQRVRSLRGRYLWLRVELFGDGRSSPEIAALRAWVGRFDYVEHYLPRLYRESPSGAAATAPGELLDRLPSDYVTQLDAGGVLGGALRDRLQLAPWAPQALPRSATVQVELPGRSWLLRDDASRAVWPLRLEAPAETGGDAVVALYRPQASPSDFLSRQLANFEGLLTTLEDRVAAAHLLTDPAVIAEPQLDWLAAWIGVAFDPALPRERRREWLQAAPRLARWHGTRRGLALALDTATGGGVRGGEIVVVEDFRLRRLMATLLGVDLSDEDDPLLPGLARSGNSHVGDTAVLGDTARDELLALFDERMATAEENQAALDFLGRLAHRATVLVHQEVQPQDLGLLRRIAELESPAHVQVRVVTATEALRVGVASLVGVDTYLGPAIPPRAAQVQVSVLGGGDRVVRPAVLDPRMAGAAAPPLPLQPRADAGDDLTAPLGESFVLDGSGSAAAPGRHLTEFRWRRMPPPA